MKAATYTRYLEAVILALLAERKHRDAFIKAVDSPQLPPVTTKEFSPASLRLEMREQRKARGEPQGAATAKEADRLHPPAPPEFEAEDVVEEEIVETVEDDDYGFPS